MLGFEIAAVVLAFVMLRDSSPPPTFSPPLLTFEILCPPAFLSFILMDIDSAAAIAIVWLVIGILNAALYAVIGTLIGRFCWKSDRQTTTYGADFKITV